MMNIIANTIQLHVACFDISIGRYKYLVLKRADNCHIYPGLWQVITGRIEQNENAVQAALRELKEETGIITDRIWSLPYVASFHNIRRNAISAAPCFGVVAGNENIQLSDEHSSYEWLNEQECLNRLVLPSHKEGTGVFKNFVLESKFNEIYLID